MNALDILLAALTGADPHGAWILVIGCMAAVACALIGCFLVLQRMAMMGDAISHAVLPGIVIAFLFTGGRNILPMLIGAGALGLLTAFLTDILNRQGRLQNDAAIGVTFTWLFAIGVILVSRYAGQVDLDLDCVLYGEILFAPFDTLTLAGRDIGPRAAWTNGLALLLNLLFVVGAWKQLKLASFDPVFAAAIGLRIAVWHYLLMAAVSVTTVAAFESVGAILVVAMLVVPPNTAYLLTDRLWLMVLLACAAGVLSTLLGYLLATALDSSIAASMATVSGALYLLVVFAGPRHGVLARWWRQRNPLRPDAFPDPADAHGGRT